MRERATRKKGVAEGRGEKTHLSTSMVNFLGSVAAMVGDKVPNSVCFTAGVQMCAVLECRNCELVQAIYPENRKKFPRLRKKKKKKN